MRTGTYAAAAVLFALSIDGWPLGAAPCKDAKSKFIKCPPPATTATKCRNANGEFSKRRTPGAKPA